ncbi:MAG TPA: hypothetical protein ENG87_01345, partial [Candidatus Pacearchaeota archaeon]|nr:hypothetical protein [Candidatus Pacearchaeota archaeon]
MNRKIKGLIEVLIIVTLFLLFSYLVQKNISYFESLIVNDVLGILVFIFIEFISIVVAPVTTLPLIPIASNLWGWVLTGLISIFAWSFGAWVAFVIGRKYGVQIIKKFISLKDIYRIEKKVP